MWGAWVGGVRGERAGGAIRFGAALAGRHGVAEGVLQAGAGGRRVRLVVVPGVAEEVVAFFVVRGGVGAFERRGGRAGRGCRGRKGGEFFFEGEVL